MKNPALKISGAALFASTLIFTLHSVPLLAQNFNRPDTVESESLGEQPAPLNPTTAAPPQPPAPLQATDIQVRMNALENLVRNLTGQVERLQFSNNQLMQQAQKMNGDNDVRFRELEQKLAQQDTLIKGISAQQLAAAQAAQSGTSSPPATTAAPANAAPLPTQPAVDAPEKPAEQKPLEAKPAEKTDMKSDAGGTLGTLSKNGKKDAQGEYDAAFDSMRHAKYEDAESAFRSFLKNNPKHRLTENAKYWLAETLYVRGKFAESAVAFAEGYEQFPKGAKAPDNLLKLAMSLGSLGKKQDACLTLSELSKNFPKSSAVTNNRVAQEKKSFGCS